MAAVPPVTWLTWLGREIESRVRIEKTGFLFRSNHTAMARVPHGQWLWHNKIS